MNIILWSNLPFPCAPDKDKPHHAVRNKIKMETTPIAIEDDLLFDVGMGCCVSPRQYDSTRSLEDKGSAPAPSNKQPALKRLSSTAKLLKAKLTTAKCPTSDGDKRQPRSVAHKHFGRKTHPELLGLNSLIDDSCDVSTSPEEEEEEGVALVADDDDDDGCASRPCSLPTPEEALALEVGHNAHEYLEECFYTEAAVLCREKFDAIPQIDQADFTVMSHLGKGNFSDVFHVCCNDGQSRRCDLAMKSLRPQIRTDEEQFTIGAEDLIHETAILANLDHRNIIKLHGRASGPLTEAFLNEGYFILLDKLNETLHSRFAAWKQYEGALRNPMAKQLEVAHSIANAMTYLHSRKIVFRDLKPDNVGFDHRGELKLFDFGFAIGLPEKNESNPAGFLYDRCGTPRYMAPEVAFSLGYGTKADVYSFGILIWEMCALEKPFAKIRSADEFEKLVFMGGLRPAINKRWPTHTKGIIRSCWCATPSKRPNMPDVKFLLASLIQGRK